MSIDSLSGGPTVVPSPDSGVGLGTAGLDLFGGAGHTSGAYEKERASNSDADSDVSVEGSDRVEAHMTPASQSSTSSATSCHFAARKLVGSPSDATTDTTTAAAAGLAPTAAADLTAFGGAFDESSDDDGDELPPPLEDQPREPVEAALTDADTGGDAMEVAADGLAGETETPVLAMVAPAPSGPERPSLTNKKGYENVFDSDEGALLSLLFAGGS
jgi:hypothetical protein